MIKPVTSLFLLSALILAVSHQLSLELALYWRYAWLDMPMHLLGGVTVALGYLSARDFLPRLPRALFSFLATLVFVVLIACVWEVFEIQIGVIFDEANYVTDTIADLMLGVVGASIGYAVARSINQLYL